MSSLSPDFFSYVWAMHRIADRYDDEGKPRRGMQALSFSEALLELSTAAYEDAYPHDVSASSRGSWHGAAWYTPAGVDKVTRITQPGKNLFSPKKNLAQAFDRFLKTPFFGELETEKITLAELLARNDEDLVAFEKNFPEHPAATLRYRGPVVSAIDRRERRRRGHEQEPVAWLGILPRDIIDLFAHRDLLLEDNPLRLLLLRRGLGLFEPLPTEPLRTPTWRARALLHALIDFHAGEITKTMPKSEHVVADFGGGRQHYWFLFPERTSKVLQFDGETRADAIVWVDQRPLDAVLASLASGDGAYRGRTPGLLCTEEMGAAIWQLFPWLWHRPEGQGTIRPQTYEDVRAQVTVIWAASALHALVGFYCQSTDLLRAATAFLGVTDSFDTAIDALHERGLLDRERSGLIPAKGPPIVAAAMIAHDVCWNILLAVFSWLWRDAELGVHAPAALKNAIDMLGREDPAIRDEYLRQWRERFAGTREVLFDHLRAAMSQKQYEEAADLMLKLSAMGERDMLDVMWRDRFGSLRVDGSTEELLAAARAAVRSGRGLSSAVSAVVERKDDPAVYSLLREVQPQLPADTYPRWDVERALGLR
jgi:hypothetical protein